jgi:hypothetical protein
MGIILENQGGTRLVLADDLGGLTRLARTVPVADDGEWTMWLTQIGGQPIPFDVIPNDEVSEETTVRGTRDCATAKGAFDIEGSGIRPPPDPEAPPEHALITAPPAGPAPTPGVSPAPRVPSASRDASSPDDAPPATSDPASWLGFAFLVGAGVLLIPVAISFRSRR